MKKTEHIVKLLAQRNLTVAAAESCTGGYASYLLTRTPGSSKVYKGGLIAYSLSSKNKFFKLSAARLEQTQGVSAEICMMLAKKVRLLFKSDIGLAVVGFAGPAAGQHFAAGTVFIALAHERTITVKRIIIHGNRNHVRVQASLGLLALLMTHIKKRG
ncbi:MAG: CinA family protein [Candidatus Omnitrophota bacterium]